MRHLIKFQRITRLAFVTAATSLTGGQANLARCLAVSWPHVTLYINHFAPKSCVLLCWQRYCTALEQWVSAKLCSIEQRATPIFGRATITLGIGPHSSLLWSPYVIGQTIIFSSCNFYLLLLLLLLSSFFPCLISAAAGWMSTIL